MSRIAGGILRFLELIFAVIFLAFSIFFWVPICFFVLNFSEIETGLPSYSTMLTSETKPMLYAIFCVIGFRLVDRWKNGMPFLYVPIYYALYHYKYKDMNIAFQRGMYEMVCTEKKTKIRYGTVLKYLVGHSCILILCGVILAFAPSLGMAMDWTLLLIASGGVFFILFYESFRFRLFSFPIMPADGLAVLFWLSLAYSPEIQRFGPPDSIPIMQALGNSVAHFAINYFGCLAFTAWLINLVLAPRWTKLPWWSDDAIRKMRSGTDSSSV